MNRGARRLPVFGDDADRSAFLELVGESVDRHRVEVHAYALMSNHYHLLVRGSVESLSKSLQLIGGSHTQRFNAKYGLDGPLWRGRFRSKAIVADDHLHGVVRYIHLNPVANTPGPHRRSRFRWTSHLAYLGLVPTPGWLTTGHVLGTSFGGDRRSFRSFVESSAAPFDTVDLASDWRPSTDLLCRPADIELALGVASPAERDLLTRGGRGVRNDQRLAAVLLCSELTALPDREIASRYGFATASGVRTTIGRARERERTDECFARMVRLARFRVGTSA